MFTYYTIIGKDVNLLQGHVENVKEYAGFDKLPCEKEFLVIVYKNSGIPESVTSEILNYCASQDIRTYIYEEPTDSFLDNLYACWNLGYSEAKDGWIFRGGSDQVFSKNSILETYNDAKRTQGEKITLQANTIENINRNLDSRHLLFNLGDSFNNFNYLMFENVCEYILNNPAIRDNRFINIDKAIEAWGRPTSFNSSYGTINRCDGCSWIMTKENWVKYGPIPKMEKGITGDVIIHDRMQFDGFEQYIMNNCITYHFVRGESKGFSQK